MKWVHVQGFCFPFSRRKQRYLNIQRYLIQKTLTIFHHTQKVYILIIDQMSWKFTLIFPPTTNKTFSINLKSADIASVQIGLTIDTISTTPYTDWLFTAHLYDYGDVCWSVNNGRSYHSDHLFTATPVDTSVQHVVSQCSKLYMLITLFCPIPLMTDRFHWNNQCCVWVNLCNLFIIIKLFILITLFCPIPLMTVRFHFWNFGF